MIIYGQGAIRCYPSVQNEILAIDPQDVAKFDRAFFGHVNHVVLCTLRSFLLGLTGGRFAHAPDVELDRFCKQLSRFSAAFALVSDVAMGTLGGSLKRREKISRRLADALAWLYLGSAILKRRHDEPSTDHARDLARWDVFHALNEIEEAQLGVIDNFPSRFEGVLLNALVYSLGAHLRAPNDCSAARSRDRCWRTRPSDSSLTKDIFAPGPEELALIDRATAYAG